MVLQWNVLVYPDQVRDGDGTKSGGDKGSRTEGNEVQVTRSSVTGGPVRILYTDVQVVLSTCFLD